MAYNGSWNIIMKTPMGDREAKLTLAQDGDSLSGEMESGRQHHADFKWPGRRRPRQMGRRSHNANAADFVF